MWLKVGAIVGVAMLVWAHFAQDSRTVEKLDDARLDLAKSEQSLATQQETNAANLATIDSLQADNAAWADQWERHAGRWDEERARLTAELANERAARARDRDAANAELERILSDDIDAATWSAQPLPDSIADWVCQHLTAGCAGGSEGDQGSGSDGP
jgi:septal ring factor EnvC (AmiA/AmiB activator)